MKLIFFNQKKQGKVTIKGQIVKIPDDKNPGFEVPTTLKNFASAHEELSNKNIRPCKGICQIRSAVTIEFRHGINGFNPRD
jgi:hypothetical protein